jgi:hypothetical protein
MICEICGRRECVDPWKFCGHCEALHLECLRTEDGIRGQMRRENEKLIGKTTPGMSGKGAAVHERRGRKLLRQVRQDVFLEEEDESERDS